MHCIKMFSWVSGIPKTYTSWMNVSGLIKVEIVESGSG